MNNTTPTDSVYVPAISKEDVLVFINAMLQHYSQEYLLALKYNFPHKEDLPKRYVIQYFRKRREQRPY